MTIDLTAAAEGVPADDPDSGDEALLEVLGLSSLNVLAGEESCDEIDAVHAEEDDSSSPGGKSNSTSAAVPLTPDGVPNPTQAQIEAIVHHQNNAKPCPVADLSSLYKSDAVVVFPERLSIPARTMRRLTDELVWSGGGGGGTHGDRGSSCDRTYETIKVLKRSVASSSSKAAAAAAPSKGAVVSPDDCSDGIIEERRVLTRLENFVSNHDAWSYLCNMYIAGLVTELVGEEMVLYKEKLNLKPPGGSGFAPHLDAPSLRVALGRDGPQSFLTVMVAIDDMTERNGCLRVVRGGWSEGKHVDVVLPREDGNPDGDGRAGAILPEVASTLNFDDLVIKGGTVAVFGGYVPHRSSPNASPFPRRAVFLTYNPAREGKFRSRYYDKMKELRVGWRERTGLLAGKNSNMTEDERLEMEALASIPRI